MSLNYNKEQANYDAVEANIKQYGFYKILNKETGCSDNISNIPMILYCQKQPHKFEVTIPKAKAKK